MTAFVLVVISCVADATVGCSFHYTRYESDTACAKAMEEKLEIEPTWWRRGQRPGQIMCFDSRVIIFPEGDAQ